MNNMKKKVIISSIMTIVICLTLIAGSTFALFTDSDSVNVAVTAGTVDVEATIENIDYTSELGAVLPESAAEFDNNVLTIQYMVPGDVVTFDIVVTNKSNVSVDYSILLENLGVVTDGDVNLWDALEVEVLVDGVAQNGTTSATLYSADFQDVTAPANGVETHTISVTLRFPNGTADHDNDFQGATCKLACTVEAVQGNAQ